jgi:hypothetical protein
MLADPSSDGADAVPMQALMKSLRSLFFIASSGAEYLNPPISPQVWKGGASDPRLQGLPDYSGTPHIAARICAGRGMTRGRELRFRRGWSPALPAALRKRSNVATNSGRPLLASKKQTPLPMLSLTILRRKSETATGQKKFPAKKFFLTSRKHRLYSPWTEWNRVLQYRTTNHLPYFCGAGT